MVTERPMIESTKLVERIQYNDHYLSIFCFSVFLFLESNGKIRFGQPLTARAHPTTFKDSFF